MFENIIRTINEQTNIRSGESTLNKCIDKILKLRDNSVLSYLRMRDLFTLLRKNGYLNRYPQFMDYCERFSEGITLMNGELILTPMETYECIFNNSERVHTIMLRIGEDKSVLEVLDTCGTCVMSVPFVEDGKIVDPNDELVLERIKTINEKSLFSFTRDFTFWLEMRVEEFNKSLVKLIETFDLRASYALESFKKRVDSGDTNGFFIKRVEIKGGEKK